MGDEGIKMEVGSDRSSEKRTNGMMYYYDYTSVRYTFNCSGVRGPRVPSSHIYFLVHSKIYNYGQSGRGCRRGVRRSKHSDL